MIDISEQTVLPSFQESKWFGLTPNEWLPEIIAIHFDPDHGSPYWLDKENELGIKARDEIRTLDDLQVPPGNRLEALRGDRKGQHSIRINDRFRICFVWTEAGPAWVEIVDYH